jgi:mono/diheme cytochrome c family protein
LRTIAIALALFALTLAWLAAGCSDKNNAFEDARQNERAATASAANPAPATTAAPDPKGSSSSAATPAPAASAGSLASGQALFTAQGCAACHSTGSNTVVGPGLQGVGTRAVSRVSGLTAEAYFRQSVRDPGAFIVPGFNNLMPTIYASISDADLNDLVAYLLSLK